MAVPSSYPVVTSHLEQIQRDPATPLDTSLLDKLKLELTEATDPAVGVTILTLISQLLPILQEDPTPITALGIRAATNFSFTQLRAAVEPPINFVAGFKVPSPPINLLALSLVAKAGQAPSEAAIVAGDPELVSSLVELWLSTPSTAVSQAAFDAIWALLEIDLVSALESYGEYQTNGGARWLPEGQGLLWRRFFADSRVYGLLFSLCSLRENNGSLSKREKTIAQGRLMDFLVKAGRRRWDLISTARMPEIEEKYQSSSILHFAACRMVDTGDVLMHMTLLNFFRELLDIDAPGLLTRGYMQSRSTSSSPSLDFLISQGLHSRVLGYYLDDGSHQLDAVDAAYLANPVMAYVADYARLYPNHLLQGPRSLVDGIFSRIRSGLAVAPAQWAHGPLPSGHILILSCLPRVLLVSVEGGQDSNPLQLVPTRPASKEALDALGRIFHGPVKSNTPALMESNSSGTTATDWYRESAAARVLYFLYLNRHRTLWDDVVSAAGTLAMKEVALAAHSFMEAVVTAIWQPLTPEVTLPGSQFPLPTEEQLQRLFLLETGQHGVLPSSGVWVALMPPALTTLLPYLFSPPRSYSEFVGGGASDVQNVVWKVATAKYEVLVSLYNGLKGSGSHQADGFSDIVETLRQRVNQGPLGPTVEIARVEATGM